MVRSAVSTLFSAALLLQDAAVAEKYWLHKIDKLPEARTFQIVHYHTIDSSATSVPEISLLGPLQLSGGDASTLKNVQLHILHHSAMNRIKSDHFCCTAADVEAKTCKTPGNLILTDQDSATSDVFSFSLAGDKIAEGYSGIVFKPAVSGLFFVALSNCGETDFSNFKFEAGEISVVSPSGYLPAEEAPKLSFYMYLALGYAFLLTAWFAFCYSWSSALFTIHHFITVAIATGLLEAMCWYTSLFHWNYLGHRWKSMMALATLATTVKQGLSYALLLLACLGVGVTKPKAEKKTLLHISLVTVGFVITESVRQFLMIDSQMHQEWSTFATIMIVAPGSFFVSCLYVWILQALQDTINELNETKQTVKAEVYQSLRLALGLVCGVVIAFVAYESIVVRREDLSDNWATRWVFTDAASHTCFFFLVCVIMYLWKPNENSQNMAYSQQLADDDGIELGGIDVKDMDDDMN